MIQKLGIYAFYLGQFIGFIKAKYELGKGYYTEDLGNKAPNWREV